MQVNKYQKPSKTFSSSKIVPENEDFRGHHKKTEPLQLMLDNEQQKVYLVSREELEKRHRHQKELAKKAQYVQRRPKEGPEAASYSNEPTDNRLQMMSRNELEAGTDLADPQAEFSEKLKYCKEDSVKPEYDLRLSEGNIYSSRKIGIKPGIANPRLFSKSGMIAKEITQDSSIVRGPYMHMPEFAAFSDVTTGAPEKTQSLPHTYLSSALSTVPSQTISSSSLQRPRSGAKQEPQEPLCQKTVLDKSHRRHLSGDLETLLSSCHARQASQEEDDRMPVSKSAEEESKLSASPQTQTASKVWDDPGDICPWEDDTLTPTWL